MGRYILLTLLGMIGCATSTNVSWIWAEDYKQKFFHSSIHTLQAGDRISVLVWNQPQLSAEHVIRKDGCITIPLVEDICVLGMTTSQAAIQINLGLRTVVLEPRTTVSLVALRTAVVFVVGEVNNQGEFQLTRNDGVLEILAKAGGLTAFADRDRIFVISKGPEQARIRFDYKQLQQGFVSSINFKLRDGDILVVE